MSQSIVVKNRLTDALSIHDMIFVRIYNKKSLRLVPRLMNRLRNTGRCSEVRLIER